LALAVKETRPYYQFQPWHLDILLAHGWFRMGRYMFSVQHIGWHRETRVFWIRYQLSQMELPDSACTISKRASRFQFIIREFELNEAHKNLYAEYHQSVTIDTADSLAEVLFRQEAPMNLAETFPSMTVEMYDEGKLVGAGIFDTGRNSIMGIVNYFLPEYRKFSPGKALMLKKIEWAMQAGMDFYYPGYIGVDDNRFDYKLFAGHSAIELYDPFQKTWIPFKTGLAEKLASIQKQLIRQFPEPLWLNPLQSRMVLEKFGA
jgi:arginyl-tRNA--protein-N-Asp/Glu arginylyltransferase